jgi:ssRNA-specific RNase YbeY (16S rRNA maturation enzyme)
MAINLHLQGFDDANIKEEKIENTGSKKRVLHPINRLRI